MSMNCISHYINNEKIIESTTAGIYHTIGEAVAYASWEE
jgi:hypothetical protein